MNEFITNHFGLGIFVLVSALLLFRRYSAFRSARRTVAGACARCGAQVELKVAGPDGPECAECAAITERSTRFGVYFIGGMAVLVGLILVFVLVDELWNRRGTPWELVCMFGVVGVLGPVWILRELRQKAPAEHERGARAAEQPDAADEVRIASVRSAPPRGPRS